ncbi:MAG: class I SAM-dependent methyltransferase [Planctomycetes bacterium]|nr:class I SAM-dependent methyltransferase [Planctomycetota bacterium]
MPEELPDWNERYAQEKTPWDTGRPSSALRRILDQYPLVRGRVLELGCGTGTNAVFLARQGFDVTAVDISPLAIERAREKASRAGVDVTLLAADLLDLPELGPPFPLVFDRGVYHAVRRNDLPGFLATLARVSTPGGMYWTLAGNANEIRGDEPGPPQVSAEEICRELAPLMDLVQLQEIRFDEILVAGNRKRPLGWSALFRRKPSE